MAERVRVTGPPRRGTRTAPVREVEAETPLGRVYVDSLLREQLFTALRVLGVTLLVLGSVPLLFFTVPALPSLRVGGVPVAWVLLGVAPYPLLVGLGWWFCRRAERNEDAFAGLMEEVDS
ncbi:hypothetical protein [Nocardioides acrostichi]|uniref:Uncharacterized protein n=1 Tax=Nocardioides acrostichi TaxID=2784339 RepID=A0A930UYJ6_9ACTN|nr:hypothetical protein [Nocardioides acrostichi]MBF4163243.1 hypothetical protein [Nocardioides acrostichi]